MVSFFILILFWIFKPIAVQSTSLSPTNSHFLKNNNTQQPTESQPSVLTGRVVPARCFDHRGLLGFQRPIWHFLPLLLTASLRVSWLTPYLSPSIRQAKPDSRSLIASSNWASVSFLFLHGLLAREKRGAGHRLARLLGCICFGCLSLPLFNSPSRSASSSSPSIRLGMS